jgi:hypothetical protein
MHIHALATDGTQVIAITQAASSGGEYGHPVMHSAETVSTGPIVCKFCGAVGAGQGYPFSTLPKSMRTCDDCA